MDSTTTTVPRQSRIWLTCGCSLIVVDRYAYEDIGPTVECPGDQYGDEHGDREISHVEDAGPDPAELVRALRNLASIACASDNPPMDPTPHLAVLDAAREWLTGGRS